MCHLKTKEKASKRGKKECNEKRMPKILFFCCVIQLRKCNLHRLQRKQLQSKSSVFDAVTQFLDVESESQKEKLSLDVLLSPSQEPSETVIFLQNSEYTLHLNGSIHPEQSTFFTGQFFKSLRSMLQDHLVVQYQQMLHNL